MLREDFEAVAPVNLRVLHLMSCRGWSSDAYWAARACAELERAGHHVSLCCRAGTEEKVIRRVRDLGLKRIETLRFRKGWAPLDDLADLKTLLAWFPRFDVAHVHRGKEHWLAAVANRLSRRPVSLVRTRHIVHPVKPHAANRWLYRKATDLVVTVSEAIRQQYVASALIAGDSVVALHGGVDAEAFNPRANGSAFRASLGLSTGTQLIGLAGGFRVMKGHLVVVEAAARLAREGLRPAFLFIGRGSGEKAVREAISREGLERQFVFTGFVPDLPRALAAMDVALYVPIESDGMGRIAYECLAAGRPLVASRVGVVPEILTDGRDALLVPAGDSQALATAIRMLLGEPELRRSFGLAGRELVESRYSGARLAGRLAELYSDLASARYRQ
jgi:glycosyltransferase involved in cell wall biosynthesis